MLEKQIEEKLVKEVKKLKGICLKLNSQTANGVPDRMVLIQNGGIYFVELKRPGRELDPLQKYWKKNLEYLGFEVFKIDSLDKVDDFIKRIGGGKEHD